MTTDSAYTKRWKETPSGRESTERYESSERGLTTRRRNREIYKARHAEDTRERARIGAKVRYAVRTGRLVRQPCLKCGSERVHAHHHNGYAPEHELDVVWLCPKHHMAAHGRLKAA